MTRQVLVPSGIVVFVIWCAAATSGQNLVYNGSFESNLQGYTLSSVPIGVSPMDAAAATDSGSALIVNNYPNRMNGQGIHQCLYGFTFTPGASMVLGGKILLPTGQSNTGWSAVGLNWYTQANCQVAHNLSGPRAEVKTPGTTFQPAAQTYTVPSGAVSAMLVAYVTKSEDGGSLLAFLDDLYVVPVGTTPNSTQIWVPTAAHNTGSGGSAWRTDLEIANPNTTSVSYVIELLKKNQANPAPQRVTYTINAGLTIRYSDVVLDRFAFEGSGALRITPTGGGGGGGGRAPPPPPPPPAGAWSRPAAPTTRQRPAPTASSCPGSRRTRPSSTARRGASCSSPRAPRPPPAIAPTLAS
jgi:hypothetical protein